MTLSVPFLRTELLGCYSDQDFLAKLHCVRQAFEVGVVQEPLVEDAGPAIQSHPVPGHESALSTGSGSSHSPPSFLRGF